MGMDTFMTKRTIVTFQNGAWHAGLNYLLHADCDVSRWRRFGTNTPTTSFLDFSRLENAQATHKHTEQPRTQLESVSFVDTNILLLENG